MKEENREAIKFAAILSLSGCLFLLFITFLSAYNHPTKSVTIFVDNQGEGSVELFAIFPVIGALAAGGLFLSGKDMFIINRRRKEK